MEIGIMQGRLVPPAGNQIQSFPRENWSDEFPRASQAGLSFIEWIYDVEGADVNPLATPAGIELMRKLSTEHKVAVSSVCADYFIDQPLVRAEPSQRHERSEKLKWLLHQAARLPVAHVVLPFVDASSIRTEEDTTELLNILRAVLPTAEETNVELHLEMSLPPQAFAKLLERIPHRLVRANYDSGNSASLGYKIADEFAAYGERIGSVHIKDRVRDGGTVPLGAGDADLPELVRLLREIRYAGNLVLQVARGETGKEVEWARQNKAFVERLLTEGGR
jgi:L-ribulose-5-phosphate 3-epimerase